MPFKSNGLVDEERLKSYDVLSSQKPMSEENYSLVQQETKDLTDTIDHDKPIDFDQILD